MAPEHTGPVGTAQALEGTGPAESPAGCKVLAGTGAVDRVLPGRGAVRRLAGQEAAAQGRQGLEWGSHRPTPGSSSRGTYSQALTAASVGPGWRQCLPMPQQAESVRRPGGPGAVLRGRPRSGYYLHSHQSRAEWGGRGWSPPQSRARFPSRAAAQPAESQAEMPGRVQSTAVSFSAASSPAWKIPFSQLQ